MISRMTARAWRLLVVAWTGILTGKLLADRNGAHMRAQASKPRCPCMRDEAADLHRLIADAAHRGSNKAGSLAKARQQYCIRQGRYLPAGTQDR